MIVTLNENNLVARTPGWVLVFEEVEEGLYRSDDGKKVLHWESSPDTAFLSTDDEVIVLTRR